MPRPTIFPTDPLATLRECQGYYMCPKLSVTGQRLGPLVGYAGKYEAPDGSKKSYVGEVYYNFAKAEEEPFVLHHFGSLLASKIKDAGLSVDAVLGAPMGGLLLAGALGFSLGCRVLFAEKKVTAVATEGQREQSVLSLDRHQVEPGERVAIVEDVTNNFSTTDQLVRLVEQARGRVVIISTFLNRSPHAHYPADSNDLPVISVVHVPTQQWKQEDDAVAADIQAGNVVWKPKIEWSRLKEAQDSHNSYMESPI